MNLPTRDELRTLASTNSSECVSVFLPTHRTGRDLRQDPIRFKNLLAKAEERLQERGVRSPDARGIVKPARQLFDDEVFRRHQSDGLALFLTPELLQHYSLPLAFEEEVVVNRRFYMKPLLPLLNGDGVYSVLVLSQKKVQVLEASRYSIRAIDLASLPNNLADALHDEMYQKQLQLHSGGADGGAMFHGQGSGKDVHKDKLLRYFRQIDGALHDFLKNKNRPLVLAGVDYYLPIYREANTYAHLMESVLPGNHDADNMEQLHDASWQIVESLFTKPERKAVSRYQQLAGTDKTTTKLGKILPNAYQGRIDTLFVAAGKKRSGQFNLETSHIQTTENKEADSEDLFDLAAVQTFLNGGSVYVMEENGILAENPVAAIFRY